MRELSEKFFPIPEGYVYFYDSIGYGDDSRSFSGHKYKNFQRLDDTYINFRFGDYANLVTQNIRENLGETTFNNKNVYRYEYYLGSQNYNEDQRNKKRAYFEEIEFLKDGIYLIEAFYLFLKYYNANIDGSRLFNNRSDLYWRLEENTHNIIYENSSILSLEKEKNSSINTGSSIIIDRAFPILCVVEVNNGAIRILEPFEINLNCEVSFNRKDSSEIYRKSFKYSYNKAEIKKTEGLYFYKKDRKLLNFEENDLIFLNNGKVTPTLLKTVQAEDWWGFNNDIFYKLALAQLCVYKIK